MSPILQAILGGAAVGSLASISANLRRIYRELHKMRTEDKEG